MVGDLRGVGHELIPKTIGWRELTDKCRSTSFDGLLDSWRVTDQLARRFGVDARFVRQQLRLHVGSPTIAPLLEQGKPMPRQLMEIVEIRARRFTSFNDLAQSRAGSGKLAGMKLAYSTERSSLLATPAEIDVRMKEVDESVSDIVEGSLHYMQAPRADATHRLGLVADGFQFPFCYASITRCDRTYILNALESSLNVPIDRDRVAVLARVYGVGATPMNSISTFMRLISASMRGRFDLLVTALNPFLLFDGYSLIASGFVPFAISPVAYFYTETGEYRTRRHLGRANPAAMEMPPNILLARAMSKDGHRLLQNQAGIARIEPERHRAVPPRGNSRLQREEILGYLFALRGQMESVWSASTRYHGTNVSSTDPISRGQCGVTSAFLAGELENAGWEVFFCEGDVYFADGTDPIIQHCWLRIPETRARDGERTDLIIDITADQTGYKTPVVSGSTQELKSIGVEYRAKSETAPRKVGADHLWARLHRLEDELGGAV